MSPTRLYLSLVYGFWLAAAAAGLEVGVPERFLPPRNFNHHPYTDVVDPGGTEDQQPQQVFESQLAEFVRDSIPDLPEHPYALFQRPLTRGDDGRAPIQFPKVPEGTNIPSERQRLKPASIKHPLNLGRVQQQRLYSPQSLKPDKKYAFSYSVLDRSSGDDFSHSQLGAGGQTKGEYRVKLPDGRLQIVSYTADHRGYRADVRYDEQNLVEHGPPQPKYAPAPAPQLLRYHQPATLHHRDQIPHQIHLPKPAYKAQFLDYEDTTLQPIRDHTPIHEENQEDFGDYQENTVSSTPSYGGEALQPSLIQRVSAFQGPGLGERAGPVKFPPTPPPQQEEENSRYAGSTAGPSGYEDSDQSGQPVYFTTPSSLKLFLGSDGQLYRQK